MKFFREPHDAERLSVAFGMSAAEIPPDVLFGVSSLLVRDYSATIVSDGGKTTRHRLVIAEKPVAVKFEKVRKGQIQIIERERACGMPSNLHFLPGSEPFVNLSFCLFNLRFHRSHLTVEINRTQLRVLPEFVQLLFEFDDRLLEFQGVYLHLTVTGVSFTTKANSSSMSAGPSMIPVPGFCTLGVWGFVSE